MFSPIFQNIFLGISAAFVVASMVRYIYSILKGHSKPNLIGWALYQIATLCVLLSAFELGSIPTIMLTLIFAISQAIVIMLCPKYGYVKFTRSEVILFMISLICLLFWIFVKIYPKYLSVFSMTIHDADIVLLSVNTFIEVLGAIAIFVKLYKFPGTEDSLSWILGGIAGIFALLALDTFTYEDVLYPLYLITTNLAIWILCLRHTPRGRVVHIMNLIEKIAGDSRSS